MPQIDWPKLEEMGSDELRNRIFEILQHTAIDLQLNHHDDPEILEAVMN